MNLPTYDVPPCRCPACGYEMDAVTAMAQQAAPEVGDFAGCLKCGHILRFDVGLVRRSATEAEVLELRRTCPQAFAHITRVQRHIILHDPLGRHGERDQALRALPTANRDP